MQTAAGLHRPCKPGWWSSPGSHCQQCCSVQSALAGALLLPALQHSRPPHGHGGPADALCLQQLVDSRYVNPSILQTRQCTNAGAASEGRSAVRRTPSSASQKAKGHRNGLQRWSTSGPTVADITCVVARDSLLAAACDSGKGATECMPLRRRMVGRTRSASTSRGPACAEWRRWAEPISPARFFALCSTCCFWVSGSRFCRISSRRF